MYVNNMLIIGSDHIITKKTKEILRKIYQDEG